MTCYSMNEFFFLSGNRAQHVERHMKKSIEALQLTYVDLYLIHTPFAVPETDGELHRDENGDVLLETTNHINTWQVF